MSVRAELFIIDRAKETGSKIAYFFGITISVSWVLSFAVKTVFKNRAVVLLIAEKYVLYSSHSYDLDPDSSN
jgi:hypothetical protein